MPDAFQEEIREAVDAEAVDVPDEPKGYRQAVWLLWSLLAWHGCLTCEQTPWGGEFFLPASAEGVEEFLRENRSWAWRHGDDVFSVTTHYEREREKVVVRCWVQRNVAFLAAPGKEG